MGTDVTSGCVPGGNGGTEELRAAAEILQTNMIILDADSIDDATGARQGKDCSSKRPYSASHIRALILRSKKRT